MAVPRLTRPTLKVLKTFLDEPVQERSGAEIIKETKLFSGTLYPILLRLEREEWLSSRWEEIDPAKEGRPRRRYYKLTALGQRSALDAFSELALVSDGQLAWTT